MNREDRITGLLGLACRAGAIAAGAMQTEKALLSGNCKLLLIAADTAAETRARLLHMAEGTQTPCITVLTKDQMGVAVGKSPKAALAVNDSGFAGSIRRLAMNGPA